MSDAWDDLGAKPRPTTAPAKNVRLEMTARFVRKGWYMPSISRADIDAAIDALLLERRRAAEFAARYLSWQDAWEIGHGARYVQPPDGVVRPEWKTIAGPYLTAAERRLRDADRDRLVIEEPRRMPS